MLEYKTANGSSYQEAYEDILEQLGIVDFVYLFHGVKLTFPSTWNTSAQITVTRPEIGTTAGISFSLSQLFNSNVSSSVYTISAYRILNNNSLSITYGTRATQGMFLYAIEEDLVYLSMYSYLGTNGTNYEVLLKPSTWATVIGNSNYSVAASCFYISRGGLVNTAKSEQCLVLPLLYIGGFKEDYKIIPNFCILTTATSYPMGTTFEYQSNTYELLVGTDSGYNRSYICRKISEE